MRLGGGIGIVDQAEYGVLGSRADQGMQHGDRVGIAARPRIVLAVGDHQRPSGAGHAVRDRLVRRIDAPGEGRLGLGQGLRHGIGGAVRGGGIVAVSDHRRAGGVDIGHGKAGRERERPQRRVRRLDLAKPRVKRAARFDKRALPYQRHQVVGLAKRLGRARAAKQPFHHGGRAPPGLGHVNVRIGAVGEQCVGHVHHAFRDIGVQVQAGEQRNVGPDTVADTRKQLALAILKMGAHHGTVQIEIDRVHRRGAVELIEHDRAHAFIGVLGDLGRGRRRTPREAFQPMPVRQRRVAVAGRRQVHALDRVEQRRAARQGGPAVGLLEGGEIRLHRRKGIGFVMKPANRDLHEAGA